MTQWIGVLFLVMLGHPFMALFLVGLILMFG